MGWRQRGAAFAPLAVKSQLECLDSKKRGCRVSVGAVDFKPWSLKLTVHDLAIPRAGAAAAGPASPRASSQLKIRRLYIDVELASLLRLTPVADALTVEEPALSLTHFSRGRSDIDDILERLKTPDPQPAGGGAQFAQSSLVLLIRPYEVSSGITNPAILEVANDSLRVTFKHRHKLRQLAVKCGQAVKDCLVSRDPAPARLFLGAAKAVPPDAKWTPHAELNLAMP